MIKNQTGHYFEKFEVNGNELITCMLNQRIIRSNNRMANIIKVKPSGKEQK